MAEGSPPVFVNLGSGPRTAAALPQLFAGWRELRVDVEPAARPDLVADITDLSPIGTDSVDGVWCSHCLEHIYAHQVDAALGEMSRILKARGVACVLVPDLQTVAGHIAADRLHETLYQSPAGPITPHDVVFGFGRDVARGLDFMAHRCGFTPSALIERFARSDFADFVVFRRSNFEIGAIASKTPWRSQAERDRLVQALAA